MNISSNLIFNQKSNQHGFTLIEVMVVLTLMVILLAIGVPSMRDMLVENRLSSNVNEFIAANSFARSEAIKRGQLVTVCRAVDVGTGTDSCNSSSSADRGSMDWGTGWLVFVENSSASAGIGRVDPGEDVLLRQSALTSKTHVSASSRRITYNGTGEPISNIAGVNFKFNADGYFGRIVCINRTGRARVIRESSTCG